MTRKKVIAFVIMIASIILVSPIRVAASEFNFAVVPQIPENQIDKSKTYFDLKLNPNAEQELSVVLRNDTDRDVIVEAHINSATTNSNGVVEYGENKIEPDNSLKYNLRDYATIEPEINVPAGQEVVTKVKVKMPEESFNGVMAGGITFQEKEEEQTSNSSNTQGGMAIQNKYSYVVALLMRQNEEIVTPDLKLNEVIATQVNARNVIKANLQNPEATYINQLMLKAEVTKKGSDKVLYTSETEGMQMAPNSNFSYPIPLNGQELEAGDYHLKIVAYGMKNDEGSFETKDLSGKDVKFNQRWELEKDFSITKEEAKKYNEEDVTIVKKNTGIYLWIGLLLLLFVIIVLLILVLKKRKKEEEQ